MNAVWVPRIEPQRARTDAEAIAALASLIPFRHRLLSGGWEPGRAYVVRSRRGLTLAEFIPGSGERPAEVWVSWERSRRVSLIRAGWAERVL